MYSFGRDFDEGLEVDNIFREYTDRRNVESLSDRAVSHALSEDGLDIQKAVFDTVSTKMQPFVNAAVNGIEAAGCLDIINASNDELISVAAKDACDAALSFYGQFEEYKKLMRAFRARIFLIEKICAEMIMVEFLNRINCI